MIFVEESFVWYSVSIALLWDHKASCLLLTPEGHIQFHPVNSYGQEGGVSVLKTLVCVWSHHYFHSLSLRLINSPAINGQLHQSMWRKWISPPLHFHIHKYNKSLILSWSPLEHMAEKTSVCTSIMALQCRQEYENFIYLFFPRDEMIHSLERL